MRENNATQTQRERYHILKTDPDVFQAVLSGAKTFEIRLNDRDYAVGDVLGLRETKHTGAEMRAGAPLEYTGRECQRFVSHVLTGYGLADGWCCLSFRLPHAAGESVPVASAEVMDALNWVDDFIARCNRDDRGSCESVNVLRRALASAPVADERAAFSRAEISFPLTIPENRVYLAGPMTGYKDHNFPAFHAAAERLRRSGLEVVNPADHGLVNGLGWSDYMRWDLVKMAGCHAVYVLPGWEKSKGASLEVTIARALGMPVFTVDGAPLASAPVAGEAQIEVAKLAEELGDLASDMAYEANQEMDQDKASRAALIERGERALRRFADAAPQASAEDALTAPADVAQLVAFIFDRFGQPGDAGALPDNVAAAVRRLERGIKAQADKDGDQQRAGDGKEPR